MKKKILLLNPPFFRFCGGHNNKIPLSLSYFSSVLENAGLENIIYNADFTFAKKIWNLKYLFENFDDFKKGVDNQGSLYLETMEIVLSFEPEVVIIAGADSLLPTKDWGNPYIAANFSKRLREFGIFTIGVGPYFNLNPEFFIKDFDSILTGEPSDKIVNIINLRQKGIIGPGILDLKITPNLENNFPKGQIHNGVLTSLGCRYPCSFCIAGKQYRELNMPVRFVPEEVVVKDIQSRDSQKIYLEDLNFTYNSKIRLSNLVTIFEKNNLKNNFTIECRIDSITEELLTIYKRLNVETIKIGIESFSTEVQKQFSKEFYESEAIKKIELIKSYGINVICYLLIGGSDFEKSHLHTIELIEKIKVTHAVVSIWAYNQNPPEKYDTQFSPITLERWGISKSVFFKFLELQGKINPTVGEIIL